jgi:hypothetical protein
VTAPTPTPAALSPAFARWYRIGLPLVADAVLAAAWANQHEAERTFWAEVDAAQEPHAADSAAQLRYERDQLVGVNDNLRSQLGRARAALGKLADDGNLQAADLLTDLAVVHEPHAAPEPAAQPPSPEPDGTIVIGPQCFADAERDVISWRGENYYRRGNLP